MLKNTLPERLGKKTRKGKDKKLKDKLSLEKLTELQGVERMFHLMPTKMIIWQKIMEKGQGKIVVLWKAIIQALQP